MPNEIVLGFNGGEVSRNMESRVDMALYKQSLSIAENTNLLPEGTSQKRAGTEFLSYALEEDSFSTLKAFNYSDDYSYMLEFGDLFLRIWSVQSQVALATIPSPYTALEAREAQYHRENDIAWFQHPAYPEWVLSRTSVTTFTFAAISYTYPPLLDQFDPTVSITPDGVEGNINLTTSSPYFTGAAADWIGTLIAVNQIRTASDKRTVGGLANVEMGNSINGTGATFTSDPLWTAFSKIGLNTSGNTWRGRLSIEESTDFGVSWTEVYFITDNTGAASENFQLEFDERRGANSVMRVKYIGITSCVWRLFVIDSANYGLARITGLTSSSIATAEVVSELYNTGVTFAWYEEAFSARNGYARCSTISDSCRWLSGNIAEPNGLWRSRFDDYNNFQIGITSDEGIRRRPNVSGTSQFFVSKDSLLLVTSVEVIQIAGQNSSLPIGPDNLKFIYNTGDGAAYFQGEIANDAILFVQKGSKKVRDMVYSDEAKSFVSNDISILAKNITGVGILETDLQRLPEQRLFTVLQNNQLGLLTYERAEKLVAWHRYITNGKYHSVGVAVNGEEDSVWYCVERNGKFMIEVQKSINLEGFWQLDSAITETGLMVCQVADSIIIEPDPSYKILITKTGHGYTGGEFIRFKDVTGFEYLNGRTFQVDFIDASNFYLKDESGIDFVRTSSFQPTYIDVIGAGEPDVSARYFPDAQYAYLDRQGFVQELDDETYLVSSPIPVNLYVPNIGKSAGNTGSTTAAINYGTANVEIEIEISQTITPTSNEVVWGRPTLTELGSINFNTDSANFGWRGTSTIGNSFNMAYQVYPAAGNYDLSGTPHRYKLRKVGVLAEMFLDDVLITTRAVVAGSDFGDEINGINLQIGGTAGYRIHSLKVTVGSIVTVDYAAQKEDALIWYDQSAFANDLTFTSVSWLLLGLAGTDPGWSIGKLLPLSASPIDRGVTGLGSDATWGGYLFLDVFYNPTLQIEIEFTLGNPDPVFTPEWLALAFRNAFNDSIAFRVLDNKTVRVVAGGSYLTPGEYIDVTIATGERATLKADGITGEVTYNGVSQGFCTTAATGTGAPYPFMMLHAIGSPALRNNAFIFKVVITDALVTTTWLGDVVNKRFFDVNNPTTYVYNQFNSIFPNETLDWYQSPSNPLEWYVAGITPTTDPGLIEPEKLSSWISSNGDSREGDYIAKVSPTGINGIGNLSDNTWAFGDGDSLGFNTVYWNVIGAADPLFYPANGVRLIGYETEAYNDFATVKTTGDERFGESYQLLYTNPQDIVAPPRDGWLVSGQTLAPAPTIDYPFAINWSGTILGTFCEVINEILGLDHLEGLEVVSLADLSKTGSHVVVAGAVTLDDWAGNGAIVGLKYQYRVSPLPIEGYPNSDTLGIAKSISEISLKLKDSYGGQVGTDQSKLSPILTRLLSDPIGQSPDPFDGDVDLNPSDGWEKVKRLYIVQDEPFPFELLSISLKLDIGAR